MGPTRGNRGLDFFIYGKHIEVGEENVIPSPLSDHKAIKITIGVTQPDKSTKRSKIQNRRAAEQITTKAMEIAKKLNLNAEGFLRVHNELRKRTKLEKEITRKQGRNTEGLLETINQLKEHDKDIDFIINEHWKNFWLDTQDKRWSQESREAFGLMRKITKYNQFNKRDGEVVHKIKMEDNTIISNPEEINKVIMEQLKAMQILESEPKYDKELPMPKLPNIPTEITTQNGEENMAEIIKRM